MKKQTRFTGLFKPIRVGSEPVDVPRDVPSLVGVQVDRSQFPDAVTRDLHRSLASGAFNHKFHYESPRQVTTWIDLHRRYSPFYHDPQCAKLYEQAFTDIAKLISDKRVQVIGLGSGSGHKDIQLVKALLATGKKTSFIPSDVSVGMAITAWQNAIRDLPCPIFAPVVCDLVTAPHPHALFASGSGRSVRRIVTFFGMIPNFEPEVILPQLAKFCRSGDYLAVGANLLPTGNVRAAVRVILPQYNNPPTKAWLNLALSDLGIAAQHGRLRFKSGPHPSITDAVRIQADFRFTRTCRVPLHSQSYAFRRGGSLRVFFSDRYTPVSLSGFFQRHGFVPRHQWITPSREEGLFLMEKADEF